MYVLFNSQEPTVPVNGSIPNEVVKSDMNENSVSPEKNDALVENQSKNSKKTSPEVS